MWALTRAADWCTHTITSANIHEVFTASELLTGNEETVYDNSEEPVLHRLPIFAGSAVSLCRCAVLPLI
ncbi:hypothetical protein OBV_41920 [Oscillibacter valericigenes Sjm18-20]|nr:hypothetical protein OBV_41920 [Oscillibacter valericigenes Sjm18-20]